MLKGSLISRSLKYSAFAIMLSVSTGQANSANASDQKVSHLPQTFVDAFLYPNIINANFGRSVEPGTNGDCNGNGFVNYSDHGCFRTYLIEKNWLYLLNAAGIIDASKDSRISLDEALNASTLARKNFGKRVRVGTLGDFSNNGFVNFQDSMLLFRLVTEFELTSDLQTAQLIDTSLDGRISPTELANAFTLTRSNFGKAVDNYSNGDFNGNGFVNFADFAQVDKVSRLLNVE